MSARILSAFLICGLLALVVWRLDPSSPEAAMARQLQGERWYRLSLQDRHLGYWHTRNHQDAEGNWIFESEQRFALGSAEPVSTTTRRVFAASPPHVLLLAEHLESRRGLSEGVRIEARPEGYAAVRVPADGTAQRPTDWHYRLGDYLEFELWLDSEQPADGARKSVDTLDFNRSARVARAFEVAGRTDSGYVIENAAPYSDTRIELDAHYLPRHLTISGLFDLTLTTRQEALAPRSVLQAVSYYVPLDRRLSDHTRISRLVLDVQGTEDPASLFGHLDPRAGDGRLRLQSPPLIGGPVRSAHREATVHIPSAHPAIRSLAAEAVTGTESATGRALALNEFVHNFLEYRTDVPDRSVLELLDDPRGDCTEFADLLTALARSLEIPATTVFGLAYADGSAPAFAYHAWNELYVDGAWMAVDPTWGEFRVDATHIPLPEAGSAALTLLTGTIPLAFSVLEVDHFPD